MKEGVGPPSGVEHRLKPSRLNKLGLQLARARLLEPAGRYVPAPALPPRSFAKAMK